MDTIISMCKDREITQLIIPHCGQQTLMNGPKGYVQQEVTMETIRMMENLLRARKNEKNTTHG